MVTQRWNESNEAKSGYVNDLFSALASRYNVMTDMADVRAAPVVEAPGHGTLALRPGDRVLDVATGTGDLAIVEAAAVGPTGRVVGVDACVPMLEVARRDHGSVDFREGDAMDPHWPDASFDVVTIGFRVATSPIAPWPCASSAACCGPAGG